jgi:GTPase SAR1 family protein
MSQNGYQSAKEKSEKVSAILRDISLLIGQPQNQSISLETGGEIVPGLGFNGDAVALTKRAHDIQQGIFNLIVLGEFKNGKSTLLNAMLGDKTLPAKSTPCTAIITILVQGAGKQIAIYESEQEQPRFLSWEAFKSEFQLTKEDQETLDKEGYIDRFKNIEYAQIESLHPLCKNGVKVIDSPGLKENINRTRVTTKYLKQAQAVIFVLIATKILSEDEREFIEKAFEPGRLDNVFFIVNRINDIDEDEVDEIKDYVKAGLKKHFLKNNGKFDEEFYNRRVFFVNAKGALDARIQTPINEFMLEASGVPVFEKELERFLTSPEKTTATLASNVQLLSWIVAQSRQKISQEKSALARPLAELEKQRQEAEKTLQELEENKQEIEQTIMLYGGMIKQKIYANLLEYITEMEENWSQDSELLINLDEISIQKILLAFASEKAKKEIADIIDRESRHYIKNKLEEWSQKIPEILQSDLNNLMNEVEAQVGEFQLEIEQLRTVFSGGRSEEVIDIDKNKVTKIIQLVLGVGSVLDISQMAGTIMGKGDWGSFLGRLLQQGLLMENILPLKKLSGWQKEKTSF